MYQRNKYAITPIFCNFCNGIRQTAVDIGVRILQNTTAEMISLPSLFQTWFENLMKQTLSTSLWNVCRFLQGF
jgi:hypothetical protein